MSEKILNIYQRINAVMKEVDYLQKGKAKLAGMYRFISHDAVVGALHGPLTKHGIVVLPTIKEKTQNGNRTEMLITVKFVNIDEPTDFFEVDFLGFGIDPSDKGPGKAISYAVKYSLLKVFCLETGDDPDQDQTTIHKSTEEPAPDPQVLLEAIKNFFNNFQLEDHKMLNNYLTGYCSHYKVNHLKAINAAEQDLEGFRLIFAKYKERELKKLYANPTA